MRIALRQALPVPRLSRCEKVTLAAPGARCRNLVDALVLVKPATVLRWHPEIVNRKWAYGNTPKRGHPATPVATIGLMVRLDRENHAWGYGKIQGELLKLGHHVSRAMIKRVLLLACDFFTVDTLFLRRLYLRSFIALGSCRVHLAGCSDLPTATWVV